MLIWKRLLIAVLSIHALWGATGLARVPLTFEPGTRHSEFVTHTGDTYIILTPTGAVLGQGSMRLIGARSSAPAQAEQLLTSYSNYLIGSDPRKWRTHVLNYRRARYQNVYPGIDVVYYGNPRELEFDFVVAPGADPRQIRIALSSPDVRIRLPRIYQDDHAIEGRAIRRGKQVTFELAAYDHSRPLVIDPVLSYAAVFGGGGSDQGRAIAVDSAGSTYVVGDASDSNFPVVNGKPGQASFLAKLSPAGDAFIFSTYLSLLPGGGPVNPAIDSSGNIYIASANFGLPSGVSGPPVVGPAPLGNCSVAGPPALYLAKLSSDGASLVYSGCIAGGGFAFVTAISVDGAGNAYIAGLTNSTDFPLVNPLPSGPRPNPGPPMPFVLKLGPLGALLYSTFVGGSNGDSVGAIAADPAGNIYLTGRTASADFLLKNAIQTHPSGLGPSAFVMKINGDDSNLVYSTYFGGSNSDSLLAISGDSSGNTYIGGSTVSGDFPTTANALQRQFNGIFAFKTTDGAATWNRSDTGLSGTASFVVDPRQPSTVYAVSGGGIFKSLDRGATWRATSAAAVTSLWIDPADSSLYMGTLHGDFVRSRDGGASFTGLGTAPAGSPNQMAFDPKNASTIYGRWGGHGSTDGVYKSTDGGDTWKPTGLVGAMTGSGPLAIDPAHPFTLYAESRNRGLVKSLDGGDTWTLIGGETAQILVDSNSTLYTVFGNTIFVLPLGGTTIQKVAPGSVTALVIDPTNSSTWYAIAYAPNAANTSNIYKSTDSGDTWQPVNKGLPTLSPGTSLAIDPSAPQTLYLGLTPNPDGFFAKLSPDGTSLQYSTYLGGSGVDAVSAIAADAAGNAYLAGTTDSTDFPLQTAFRSTGSGFAAKFDSTNKLAWSSLLGGATPNAIALGPKGDVYLTGGSASSTFATPGAVGAFVSGDVFRTADGGTTWTGTTLPTSVPLGVSAVAVDPKNPSHVFALADNLYGSSDGGQTWTKLGAPIGSPTVPVPFAGPVRLVLDPVNPTTIYVAGGFCALSVGVYTGCGVSKSTDAGVTWTLNQIAVPPANQPAIFAIGLAIDPKTSSTLYAATSAGIYKSTDAGTTWKPSGLTSSSSTVAVDPSNSSVVYASIGSTLPPSMVGPAGANGNPGLYRSGDAGVTWTAINNGLPSGWFANNLIVDPSVPRRIYASGSFVTPGLYRSDDGGNTWSSIGTGLPNSPLNALAFDPAKSSTLYAGPVAGGLYRSLDAGGSWTQMTGLRVPIVYAIAVDPSNSSRIYAGAQLNPGDAFVMKVVP